MSYIVGTTMGTALIGKLVDLYGWSAGFYTLLTGAVLAPHKPHAKKKPTSKR
jgi:sugar phosphate permease